MAETAQIPMTVLITGATGLLGSTLSGVVAAAGHSVVRHGMTGSADILCDLTDADRAAGLLADVQPDVLINLVGKTNVDACEVDPHAAYLLNVRTVENVARALRRNAGAFLIHISTDQLYDSPGPSREHDTRLTNTYALTKYAGELAAARVPSTILRTSFFGPSRALHRKSFSDWILENLRTNAPFPVFSDVVVNPVTLMTLSRVICDLLPRRLEGPFNLGSRGAMSKADFAFELARAFGLSGEHMIRCSSRDAGLRAYRPTDMSMDCTRIIEEGGVTLPALMDEIATLREAVHGTF